MRYERWAQVLTLVGGVIYAILATLHYFGLFASLEGLLPHLTLIICLLVLGLLLEQQREVVRLRTLLAEVNTKGFAASGEMIDNELTALFGDELARRINEVVDALRDQKVRVETESDFRTYYKKALEIHPKSTFYATSLASEAYFWKPGTYERLFRDFIGKGGAMERVFFVEHGPGQLSAEERRVIRKHLELGVKVYIAGRKCVPDPLQELFIVESKKRISWVSEIDANAYITRGVASSNKTENTRLVNIYKELRRVAHPVMVDEMSGDPPNVPSLDAQPTPQAPG